MRHAIDLTGGGRSLESVAETYRVPLAAVQEALDLAAEALSQQSFFH